MSAPPRPRAAILRRAGSWAGPPADRVALDFDGRHRRRIALRAEGGLALLMDLPEAARLRHGDALELEDGRLVEIAAAAEPLMEVRAPTPAELLRLAWHFGNRHLPTQLLEDRLRVRRDHVIRDLARRLGAETLDIDAPFEPEGGAYGGHGHGHGHDHGHDHSGADGAAARGDADRDAPR